MKTQKFKIERIVKWSTPEGFYLFYVLMIPALCCLFFSVLTDNMLMVATVVCLYSLFLIIAFVVNIKLFREVHYETRRI